ncbi:helix-turn-helix domain-containing protein [Phenylobacterium sp. RIFCSPHIGHO2_01_FULL_69_31]|uniref:helix-turn-helix domain-containing protein n=1 Tax=Phenylobacterium sp. RIFCSPHIGHO2_01_FULL_69_31 TaxID=1801944 RepID=UPI0025E05161|nr:helix-turn-helix domain-containing protein [Phenylobacterium sp. RIFCSPHIGHO2_01_FULL_69_31]
MDLVHLGRLPRLSPAQVAHAKLLVEGGESPTMVARSLNVAHSTLYRALRASSGL